MPEIELLRHALRSLPRQLLTTSCEQILLESERDLFPSTGLLVVHPTSRRRQPSSADPILSTITSSVFVCYKSYRFCKSPAFSMFRELTINIKLLRQNGKKTWDILHLLSGKENSYCFILYRVVIMCFSSNFYYYGLL